MPFPIFVSNFHLKPSENIMTNDGQTGKFKLEKLNFLNI